MLSRRSFIKYVSSVAAINFLIPVPLSFSKSEDVYKQSVIKTLINLILPLRTINLATETHILSEFNKRLSENSKLNQIVEYGIQWLDFNSQLLYKKDKFLALNKQEQLEILNYTVNSRQSVYPAEQNKPWTDIRVGKSLFNNLRSFTMNEFYTSEAGWKFVGFSGPPQWSGNLDYSKCSL